MRQIRILLLLGLILPTLTGCILRTHKVEARKVSGSVLSATLEQLVSRIDSDSTKITSLNATVDIATTSGGERKGNITEYQEIRGYILIRKPSTMRMIGLFPVVRNRMFDMVSDGVKFSLSIPPKNKFIVGTNQVEIPSTTPLENLRPSHIFDALILHAVDTSKEIAFLETTEETIPDPARKNHTVQLPVYVVSVVQRDAKEHWALSRKVYFSRFDLQPRKQVIFEKGGEIATIATYDNFTDYDGISFPSLIQIQRPQEEYSIQLGVVKLRLNESLKDDQFVLTQPPGSKLQVLDAAPPEKVPASQ